MLFTLYSNSWKIAGECGAINTWLTVFVRIAQELKMRTYLHPFLFAIISFIIQNCWYCAHNVLRHFGHKIVVAPRNVVAENWRRRPSAVYSVCCISNFVFE